MRLVLIHGWGFSPAIWDGLCAVLDVKTVRLDLGYFGKTADRFTPNADDVLAGHSLGVMWGLTRYSGWNGFISINGFPRFANRKNDPACAPVAALKAMRMGLRRDPVKVLTDFYRVIGYDRTPPGAPDADRLATGIDLLTMGDLTDIPLQGLILAGKDDPLVPNAASRRLAAQALRAELIWANGGHLLPQTHTNWCAWQIREWMAHRG